MIKQLGQKDLQIASEVIRASFATVAKDMNLTEENCPRHTSFITTPERLQNHLDWGWLLYGLYDEECEEKLVGYVSLSNESNESEKIYELHNIGVLPEYRHKNYGKQLLEHCKTKVRELNGDKIILSMIEENTVLKNWYISNGFIHTGTKKFDSMPLFTVGYMEWECK